MLHILPSPAMDAVAYLENRLRHRSGVRYSDALQQTYEELDRMFGEKLGEDAFGMSSMCYLLSYWAEAVCEPLDTMTIPRLHEILSDVDTFDRTVRPRITNGFLKSFLYSLLDHLHTDDFQIYLKDILTLASSGFPEYYHEHVIPLVNAEIETKHRLYEEDCIDDILAHVARMKGQPKTDITIYVSFFSYPVAFSLQGGFLSCFGTNRSRRPSYLIAHECMHGFASAETTELYRNYVNSTDELREQHRRLIEDYHSGDEEEMVMAAEQYILCLTGSDPSKELEISANRYDGCCPNVKIFLEKLLAEPEPVTDYDTWMQKTLKNLLTPSR